MAASFFVAHYALIWVWSAEYYPGLEPSGRPGYSYGCSKRAQKYVPGVSFLERATFDKHIVDKKTNVDFIQKLVALR